MKRREFLRLCGVGSLGVCAWGAFPGLARAANTNTKLLLLNLNGGIDGLYALQPNSGAVYSTLQQYRPTLALNPGSLLAGDANFGFNPLLSNFKALFDEGSLLPVLGVGYKNMSRSHLDAETAFSRGIPDRLGSASNGFLNRLGAQNGWGALRAVSVTGTDLAFEGGDYRGVQVNGLESFYYKDFAGYNEMDHLVATSYSLAQHAAPDAAKSLQKDYVTNLGLAVDSTDTIQTALNAVTPVTPYPNTQFGRALRDIHVLFAAPGLNTQVGYMRNAGFDTHSNQQTVLNKLLTELNAALGVFVSNMKGLGLWNNVVILVYSEFGRTNRENASGGTDHGGANAVFLAGGAVNGGTIRGELPNGDLTDYGWLPLRINIVEVYKRIVMQMGLDPDPVFLPHDGPTLEGMFK